MSDQGRVRRGDYVKTPLRHSNGYLCYGIGKRHKELAHRMVAETFLGPAPTPQHEVAHNNGVRTDNRAGNVRWATPGENQADRKLHGTYQDGERCGSSKLTDAAAEEIRAAYRSGGKPYVGGSITMQALADQHGVSIAQISRVVNGKQRSGGNLRYD